MRNIKLTLEYDGSRFVGFQKQPHGPTIQDALEKALAKLFNRKMKIAAASGRTDSGVHAACQVVNFKTDSRLRLDQIQKGLNAYLPKQIAVVKIKEAPPDFHARYSAKSKVYEYRIWNGAVRSPLQAAQTYHLPAPLDLSKMRAAAKILTGRRDFRSFCASDNSNKSNGVRRFLGKKRLTPSTIRNVKQFEIKKKDSLIYFTIEADGFLYHMARNLVGTLAEVGEGKLSVQELHRILESRDRRAAGRTVPAEGLTLMKVNY